MKELYYYYRDREKRPLVTVCLLLDGHYLMARGISICSPKDFPVKRIGRGLAKSRALLALKTKNRYSLYTVRDEVFATYEKITYVWTLLFPAKSFYKPDPSPFEKRLIEKNIENPLFFLDKVAQA